MYTSVCIESESKYNKYGKMLTIQSKERASGVHCITHEFSEDLDYFKIKSWDKNIYTYIF